jgi:lipoprotein-releasing system permease protein
MAGKKRKIQGFSPNIGQNRYPACRRSNCCRQAGAGMEKLMSYEIFLSRRFLRPGKDSNFVSFITLISIAGVAIGVTALIIAVSVLNGFEKEITDKAISVASHIQLTTFKPSGIEDYQSVINKISDPAENYGIVSAHPYVQREAVIKFKDVTEGIILKGVRNEDNIFSSQRKIIEGSGDISRVDSGFSSIVVGNKIASKLNISIGSKVFIIATVGLPSPANPPNVKPFKVIGIYESGLKEYDDVILYADMGDVQKLFAYGNNISGIELMISNTERIQEVTVRIRKLLGYPYYPRSVYQVYKGLFTWVELQKKPIPLVLGLIVIVAAFNIIAFLLMIVLEKTETIGVLKSLGSTNRDITKIFFYQGFLISVVGIIIGNILGYGLCLLELKYNLIKLPELYYMTRVPILIDWNTGLLITGITLLLSLLVTIIPSYLASRLNPVTSLRFK